MAMRRRFRGSSRGPQIRVNHRIRVPEVLVVDADGSNLGVLTTQEAIKRAREADLDLVEINPKGQPPVCKILDFGKYKYDESRKKRETKRKQTIVEVKEIKLRPKTDDHDLEFKVRNSRKFLESGNKVKVICRFRGREITHPERARAQLDEIVQQTLDLATVELRPTMEGRTMALLLAPKQSILQKVAQERNRRENEREAERQQQRESEMSEREVRRKKQAEAEALRATTHKSINDLVEEDSGAPSEDKEDDDFEDDDFEDDDDFEGDDGDDFEDDDDSDDGDDDAVSDSK